ncbi:DUF6440 domain-containing protein, partial [Dysosmobacter welbionis]
LLQSAVGTAGADHLPGGLRGAGRQAAARAVKGKAAGIHRIPAAFFLFRNGLLFQSGGHFHRRGRA